jgi:hypothetical protein
MPWSMMQQARGLMFLYFEAKVQQYRVCSDFHDRAPGPADLMVHALRMSHLMK